MVTFIATPTNGGTPTYVWRKNGAPFGSVTTSSTYTYAVAANGDNFDVVMTSNAPCASPTPVVSNSIFITVSSGIGSGTIGSDQTICYNSVPASITQITAPTNISTPTYTWETSLTGNAGTFVAIPSASDPNFSFTTPVINDVYIRRVITDPTIPTPCNVAYSNTVHIIVRPQLSPTIIEGNQTICSPNIFTFHGNITTGNNYEWRQLPTNTVVGTGPDFTASQSGTYSIREDNGTCSSTSAPVNLTITPTPIANAGPDQYVLANTLVTLNAGGGTLHSWSPAAELSNPNIQNPTITISATTEFTVTASDASRLCLTTDNVIIYVTNSTPGFFSTSITGPNPVMPGQQNALYSVPNQTGFTYSWSITGGTIVSGQNTNAVTVDWDAPVTNSLARTTSTPYSISVLEKNPSNQTKTTTATINTVTTAVTQSQAQSGINVFPNPTTGTFNIEMPESGVHVSYDILDLTGLSVASGTFISTGTDQTISADLDAGMYQIVLTYNNVVTCVRLSKVQ